MSSSLLLVHGCLLIPYSGSTLVLLNAIPAGPTVLLAAVVMSVAQRFPGPIASRRTLLFCPAGAAHTTCTKATL